MLRLLFTLIFAARAASLFINNLEKTVCEGKIDTISCPNGQIQIDNVLWGRTSNPVCNPVGITYGTLQCVSTQKSTNAVRSNCQGRTTCLLRATNSVLGEDPCPSTPKYLRVRYQCTRSVTNPKPTTTQSTPSTTSSTQTPPTTAAQTPAPSVQPVSTRASVNQSNALLCHEYLVSGPRGVPDGQLVASSQLAFSNNVHRGRLYTDIFKSPSGFTLEGGWTADPSDTKPWIQVKMNWLTIVTGIVTQGRHVNQATGCCKEWVTKYKVSYSIDGVNWKTIQDKSGADKVFIGNSDSDTTISHTFDCPITARFVRVYVISHVGRASMRLELMGCPTNAGDLGKCPKGWKERPGSGTCYFISDQKNTKSWENAYLLCKRRQGDILKIDSVQEKTWLIGELNRLQRSQKLDRWWVGLNNRPRFDSNYYKWDDGTGLNTNVLQWAPGQPNNSGGKEHCATYMLNSDSLDDMNCGLQLPFICEAPMYWKKPVNVPGLVTIKPTLPASQVPVTVVNKVPVPSGGNGVNTGQNFFATGCVKDCNGRAWADYQSCAGCGYYLTCAPFGPITRKCPFNTKYDDNADACVAKSSTCKGP